MSTLPSSWYVLAYPASSAPSLAQSSYLWGPGWVPTYLCVKSRKIDHQRQPVAKKIAIASGAENYNILQNNGRLAHQEVDHVSFIQ